MDRNEPESGSRTLVPGHCVRLSPDAARVVIPGSQGSHEPRVEIIREGDVIKIIELTCTCGQRMRLRCDY
jgi:hypothetical protein